jgi:hypothetical protein
MLKTCEIIANISLCERYNSEEFARGSQGVRAREEKHPIRRGVLGFSGRRTDVGNRAGKAAIMTITEKS